MSTELIPLQIDAERVIPLFATQLYQSPLALLRENAQNAFDAVRLRMYQKQTFAPRINLDIRPDLIVITDNGIRMTPGDLRDHYWTAGTSSKTTKPRVPQASSAHSELAQWRASVSPR
jgi:molecular chaperone HtpG